jgi:hypothetical protein
VPQGGTSAKTETALPANGLKESGKNTPDTELISNAPFLILALLAVGAFCYIRSQLRRLLDALAFRLESGARITIGNVDLGEVRISSDPTRPSGALVTAHIDKTRNEYREIVYKRSDYLCLAHRLYPSTMPGCTYDIWIYPVGHKRDLDDVESVEYFLGPAWNNQVFVSTDRRLRFGILVSAYGSGFLCTARINTTQRKGMEVYRYIDFENGHLGKE